MKRFALALLFLFGSVRLLAQTPDRSAPDLSTPEKTVQSFVDAVNHGDLKQAVSCLYNVTFTSGMSDMADSIRKEAARRKGRPTLLISDLKVDTEGEAATVTMLAVANDKTAPLGGLDTVTLRRDSGAWRILPLSQSEAEEMGQGNDKRFLSLVIYTISNPEMLVRARNRALAISSLSNVKQLGLAAMMFVQDSNEKFALKAATYKKSLMPYVKNEETFYAPGDKADSFSFNKNIEGKSLGMISRPADTVMIYEGKNQTLNFNHNGMAAVCFVDGHAKLVNAEMAKKLRWKP